MFQLRFLIASDRRRAPVRFTHRDYRGKRTSQDDFHPDYQTFICASYAQFLTLFEYEQKHQARIEIFPLVELFQAETNTRLKITGNETVFLTSHLEAAAKTLEEQRQGDLIKFAPTALSEGSVDTLSRDGGDPSQRQAPAPSQPPLNAIPPAGEPQPPQTTANAGEASPQPPPTTANAGAASPTLAQQIAQMVTEKKRTAADLANALGLSREAVLTAAKADPTILTITGGHWISRA